MAFHDAPTNVPDPEVVPKAKRRTFSAKYKLQILEEANTVRINWRLVQLNNKRAAW